MLHSYETLIQRTLPMLTHSTGRTYTSRWSCVALRQIDATSRTDITVRRTDNWCILVPQMLHFHLCPCMPRCVLSNIYPVQSVIDTLNTVADRGMMSNACWWRSSVDYDMSLKGCWSWHVNLGMPVEGCWWRHVKEGMLIMTSIFRQVSEWMLKACQ